MNTINTMARAGLMEPLVEILPLHGMDPRDFSFRIGEKYGFESEPNFDLGLEHIKEHGLEFELGTLEAERLKVAIDKLVIRPTSIVVTAPYTDVAELFMKDLFEWAASALEWRVKSDILKSLVFLSQVNVEFEERMGKHLTHLDALSKLFNKAFSDTYNTDRQVVFAGFGFNYDRTGLGPPLDALSQFIIERQPGVPFERNRYVCSAPLHTRAHLGLLREIERLLISPEQDGQT